MMLAYAYACDVINLINCWAPLGSCGEGTEGKGDFATLTAV